MNSKIVLYSLIGVICLSALSCTEVDIKRYDVVFINENNSRINNQNAEIFINVRSSFTNMSNEKKQIDHWGSPYEILFSVTSKNKFNSVIIKRIEVLENNQTIQVQYNERTL